MTIEVNLDAHLKNAGLTVADLASAIGITPANVFVLKNGRAKAVRFTTLNAICEVLDCQPGDILRYVEPEGATSRPP
ncbi:helix-turn-helix domain-containing protein [Microbacterium oxydans]|uniref:helix-turn-helix domain-containing protein n=1 Tax=Microbacterium oxydans TaxID=82380 RepID=UPI000F8FA516|nr:helix-turn-helix transcriptional regulator [Microbacterium oxydans]AZS46127.1 hypothetical protein CVS53_00794 [Microbacterium oxydans]